MRFREILKEFVDRLGSFKYEGFNIDILYRYDDLKNEQAGTAYVMISKDGKPVKKLDPPAGERWGRNPRSIEKRTQEAKKVIDSELGPEEVERARKDQEERERQLQARQLGNRTDAKQKRSSSVIFNVKLFEALDAIPKFGAVYEENGRLYLLVSDDDDDKKTFNMQRIYDRNIRQEQKLPRPIFALTRQMISQAPSIAERSRYTVDVNDQYRGELVEYPISYHSEVERGSKDKTSQAEFLNDPGITISSVMQESATAGATSAGSVASVANPTAARAKIKRDKKGVPKAPQKTNPDGTAKNALDVDNNLMGGKPVKR